MGELILLISFPGSSRATATFVLLYRPLGTLSTDAKALVSVAVCAAFALVRFKIVTFLNGIEFLFARGIKCPKDLLAGLLD